MQQHRAMPSVTCLGLFLCVFLLLALSEYVVELIQRNSMIKLAKHQNDRTLAMTLLGIEQSASPGPRDLDRLTTLLATFGVER